MWIATVALRPGGCGTPGDYLCNSVCTDTKLLFNESFLPPRIERKFLFCDHSNIIRPSIPAAFFCESDCCIRSFSVTPACYRCCKTIETTAGSHPAPNCRRTAVVGSKVWKAFCCTKSCPPMLRSSKDCTEAKSCWESYVPSYPPPSTQDGKQEKKKKQSSILFLSVAPLHMAFAFLFLSSVCLHVNNINNTILPCMRVCSLSLVLDDGTKTLSSNR